MLKGIRSLFSIAPKGPYNHILVLEIGGNVSGPKASEEFARKGALVIKLEIAAGDQARSYLPPKNNKPNPIFTSLNAAKASIVVDDEITYRELLALADVIIDNRSTHAKKRDGVLQCFLRNAKKHPVIFCSIVGFDGKPTLDVMAQALSGMAAVNGPYPHLPLKVGFVVVDITTGIIAASEIKDHLFALKTQPELIPENNVISIEVGMAKVVAQLMSGQYLMCKTEKKEPARFENRDLFISPFSFYKAKDAMISLAVIGGKDDLKFKEFCEKVLEDKHFAEKFPDNQFRVENNLRFETELNAKLGRKSAKEWVALCDRYGFVCAKVNTVTEALDEPFAASLFTETKEGTTIIDHPALSSLFADEEPLAPAPTLNEHREAVQWLLAYNGENQAATLIDLKKDLDFKEGILPGFKNKMQKKRDEGELSAATLRPHL